MGIYVMEYNDGFYLKSLEPEKPESKTLELNEAALFSEQEKINCDIPKDCELIEVVVEENKQAINLKRIKHPREYVLIDLKWTHRQKQIIFRGYYSDGFNNVRNYGGVTDNILLCERFTKQEAIKYMQTKEDFENTKMVHIKDISMKQIEGEEIVIV